MKLYDTGVYLQNGQEIIPENQADLPVAKEEAAKNTIAYSILKAHNKSDNMEKLQIKFDKLTSHDITFVGRTKDIATGKIRTTVGFKDGTQTSVVLNDWEDEDDTEKAIMWCLLKKCFKSKRSLEKVIYSMEDM